MSVTTAAVAVAVAVKCEVIAVVLCAVYYWHDTAHLLCAIACSERSYEIYTSSVSAHSEHDMASRQLANVYVYYTILCVLLHYVPVLQ
jgi:hypothetical protein